MLFRLVVTLGLAGLFIAGMGYAFHASTDLQIVMQLVLNFGFLLGGASVVFFDSLGIVTVVTSEDEGNEP